MASCTKDRVWNLNAMLEQTSDPEDRQTLSDALSEIATLAEDNDVLREALERIAANECEYGNGASCYMLPQSVRRSVCNPCYARAHAEKP